MFSSAAQVEFKHTVRQFSQQKLAEYRSQDYAAGYLESMAVAMFRHLPQREQRDFLAQMQAEVDKIQA